MNRVAIITGLLLTGCATSPVPINPPSSIPTNNQFISMVHGMFNKTGDIYNAPINPTFWVYINTADNVHQYLNRKELDINSNSNVVQFKLLYDLRTFKRNITNQYGYSEAFDKGMPSYTMYYLNINCSTNVITLEQKESYNSDIKILNRSEKESHSDNPELVGRVIGNSICLSYHLMYH